MAQLTQTTTIYPSEASMPSGSGNNGDEVGAVVPYIQTLACIEGSGELVVPTIMYGMP